MRAFLPAFGLLGSLSFAAAVAFVACAAQREDTGTPSNPLDAGADLATDADPGFDVAQDTAVDSAPPIMNPKTCEEAAAAKSYVGCDFWPTVVANSVWEVFDFAAIVANAGSEEAKITVTGPGGFKKEAIVGPGRLVKVYLPWVPALKGPQADECGASQTALKETVRADRSAYHLVTTRPVTVYQFNALEYEGKGGPVGKSWVGCPGDKACINDEGYVGPIGCFSFSNDASLLLPSTALTGNYRITGSRGGSGLSSYVAVTGTRDDTDVAVTLTGKGRILAGGGLSYTGGGATANFKLNAGDVMQLLVPAGTLFDLSGSLIKASRPVQVIAGVPCITQPSGVMACDHIEESVFPAETFGREYVVTMPTGPNGNKPGHVVRLYGNVDGTTLTYKPAAPKGAPLTLQAGQVVDLGVVKEDFVVTGSAEFAVGSFMLGGELVDPDAFDGLQKGDPSMSMITSVEQYRTKYVFLAPDDYLVNYVDVVAKPGTKLKLDGSEVTESGDSLGDYEVTRVKLGPGPSEVGAHVLESDKPFGIQVLGYGAYTSYHYPGGLNLSAIAPPPAK
ncbi:MAG: IgGFc-binding protein [Deltaproteobacteria bacterium]|nr:IgGFc-binding protein [Deltaproteobacteria bacterium]